MLNLSIYKILFSVKVRKTILLEIANKIFNLLNRFKEYLTYVWASGNTSLKLVGNVGL